MTRNFGVFRPMKLTYRPSPTRLQQWHLLKLQRERREKEPDERKYFASYNVYGNSVQIGTPSPDNPVEINSTGKSEGRLILNSGGVNINIPLDEPLRSLPGGVADDLEYKNVGEIMLDGTENWQFRVQLSNGMYRFSVFNLMQKYRTNTFLSSHGKSQPSFIGGYSENSTEGFSLYTLISNDNPLYFTSPNYSNVEDLKQWVSDQYAKGAPVKIQYQFDASIPQTIIRPRIRDYGQPITSLNEIQPSRITYVRDGQTFETPLANMARTLSIQALNDLPDISDQEPEIYRLGQNNIANLTEEELAIGQLKNYTII